ncbi:MAG TPA: HAMP domain-containing sensor histidine kinase [Gaiellaceae bacterium]|jgi:two-component system sensor histidine kinase BaeS
MRSLRGRLFWTIALAVLVSVSASLLLGAFLLERSLAHGALQGLGRQADLLAKGELRPATPRLGLFLATQEERLAVLPRRQAALLLPDSGGEAVAAGRRAQGTVTVNGTHYLYAARPSGQNTVVLLRDAKLADADRRPLFLALLAAGGLGALLAAALAAFLARSIAGPVRRVAEGTRRVAAGEHPEPLPVEGSTELRTLAGAFNEMAVRLERAREAERAFLLSVSHELKTPLTAIRGYTEALQEGVLDADEAVQVIHAESSRLERLVADLLELARLNRLGFRVRREPVDLAVVAADVCSRHAARARELGVSLTSLTDGPAEAEADHDRVIQVASNLVENALRCTPAGGAVTVTAKPGELAVEDTGPGIAPEDLPRAFERFFLYRRYAADRPVGTGLGLAIVRELTAAMGGTVSVESGVQAGTRFVVRLPAGGERPAAERRSQPLLDPALAEVDDDQAEHHRERDADGRESPVAFDGVGRRVPRVVGDQADGDRPHDASERVPEEKAAPRHPAEPGDPRGRVAQNGDEPAEEHDLAAVAPHQPLGGR